MDMHYVNMRLVKFREQHNLSAISLSFNTRFDTPYMIIHMPEALVSKDTSQVASINGWDLDTMLKEAESKIQTQYYKMRDEILRNMALKIIEITSINKVCTQSALRQVGFGQFWIDDCGIYAVTLANDMAANAPYTIVNDTPKPNEPPGGVDLVPPLRPVARDAYVPEVGEFTAMDEGLSQDDDEIPF